MSASNFKLTYRNGISNADANGLSRKATEVLQCHIGLSNCIKVSKGAKIAKSESSIRSEPGYITLWNGVSLRSC